MIPAEIKAICVNYFHPSYDRFLTELDGADAYNISDDGLTAKKKQKCSDFPSLFGEILIESMNNDAIYSWRFKVIKKTLYYGIGISAIFKKDFEMYPDSYSYNAFNGCIRKEGNAGYSYGLGLSKDDEIEMIFDVGKGYLSFVINDKQMKGSVYNSTNIEGIGFSGIRKAEDLKYRMAICFKGSDCIQIIDFNEQSASQ